MRCGVVIVRRQRLRVLVWAMLALSSAPCVVSAADSAPQWSAHGQWPPLRLSGLQAHWIKLRIAAVADTAAAQRSMASLLADVRRGPLRAQQVKLQTISRLRQQQPLAAVLDAMLMPQLADLGLTLWAQTPSAADRAMVQRTLARLAAPGAVQEPALLASVAALNVDAPTLIHFWARWCAPCLAELPELVQFHLGARDHLGLITVNHDPQGLESMRLPGIRTIEDPDFRVYRQVSGREAVALPATYLLLPGAQPRLLGMGRLDWRSPLLKQRIDDYTRSTL